MSPDFKILKTLYCIHIKTSNLKASYNDLPLPSNTPYLLCTIDKSFNCQNQCVDLPQYPPFQSCTLVLTSRLFLVRLSAGLAIFLPSSELSRSGFLSLMDVVWSSLIGVLVSGSGFFFLKKLFPLAVNPKVKQNSVENQIIILSTLGYLCYFYEFLDLH